MVLKARGLDSVESRKAWSELFTVYWFPLYAYLRSRGASIHDAEDLTQGFFESLFSKDRLAEADANKGKLRSFLLSMLRNYSATEWRKARTQKRGGRIPMISLDVNAAEERLHITEHMDPEAEFNRKWAYTLLEDTMREVRASVEGRFGAKTFRAILPHLVRDSDRLDYERLARGLKHTSGNLRLIVHRARGLFGEVLRQKVRNTLMDESELEEELRYIFSLFSQR